MMTSAIRDYHHYHYYHYLMTWGNPHLPARPEQDNGQGHGAPRHSESNGPAYRVLCVDVCMYVCGCVHGGVWV